MEEDSSVSENGLAGTFGLIDDSFIRLSLFTVNGLPLNTGLKRSIIDISNSHKHGANIKLYNKNVRNINDFYIYVVSMFHVSYTPQFSFWSFICETA